MWHGDKSPCRIPTIVILRNTLEQEEHRDHPGALFLYAYASFIHEPMVQSIVPETQPSVPSKR